MIARLAALRPAERIAAGGAVLCLASLLLPWYGIELELFRGFSQTGLEAFGFAHAALALTAAVALLLLGRVAGGYVPPRPLTPGGLLIAAGVWSALLIGFLAVDRPDDIAGFSQVRLRYGLFVALAGAAAMLLGGLRLRLAAGPAERGPGDSAGGRLAGPETGMAEPPSVRARR